MMTWVFCVGGVCYFFFALLLLYIVVLLFMFSFVVGLGVLWCSYNFLVCWCCLCFFV